MKAAILLLSCLATVSHASVLRMASEQRGPAEVRLIRGRSSHEPLKLSVKAFEEEHHLHLVPAPSPFAMDFKLQTTTRNSQGQLIIKDAGDDSTVSGLYHDPDTDSVVRVNGATVEGIITPTLSIRSTDDGSHEAQRHLGTLPLAFTDYLEIPAKARMHDAEHSTTTRGTVSVKPEVYIIVDSTQSNALGDDNQIINYLAVFWNAVNKRFATMSDPKINLVLSGALIVREPNDEPYITNNVIMQKYIHGEDTLNSISDWLFNQKDSLPSYDLAYLMTGKNMVTIKSGVIEDNLAGIAWYKGTCLVVSSHKRSYNTAMGEDMGLYYAGVMTTAHELAHNFGAPHDGESETKTCPWDEGYIMSYVSGKKNKLFFSSCSQEKMKEYFSSSDASCLTTIQVGEEIPLSENLPGDLISMDEQCKILTDQSGAYASKSVPEDSLCVRLECQWKVQEGNTIWTYTMKTSRPAAEGSPCRSGGSCINGACN